MVRAALPVLGSIADELHESGKAPPSRLVRNLAPRHISIDSIRPNPNQPRRNFDDVKMKKLAHSLQVHGALQPILVRVVGDGYELVAGERRLRAARMAGLEEIPAFVKQVSDHQMLELSLAENVHREGLNPVEKAKAYRTLHVEHGLSHEEIARQMGEDRTSITHTIRLAELSDAVLTLLESRQLRLGHGKALLRISDKDSQTELANTASREKWSVRDLETEIRNRRTKRPARSPASDSGPTQKLLDRLAVALRAKVATRARRRSPNRGFIQIEYRNQDEMTRIITRLSDGFESENAPVSPNPLPTCHVARGAVA